MERYAKDYHDVLIEDLREAEEAAAYLSAALDAQDLSTFLLALRTVAEALGKGEK